MEPEKAKGFWDLQLPTISKMRKNIVPDMRLTQCYLQFTSYGIRQLYQEYFLNIHLRLYKIQQFET